MWEQLWINHSPTRAVVVFLKLVWCVMSVDVKYSIKPKVQHVMYEPHAVSESYSRILDASCVSGFPSAALAGQSWKSAARRGKVLCVSPESVQPAPWPRWNPVSSLTVVELFRKARHRVLSLTHTCTRARTTDTLVGVQLPPLSPYSFTQWRHWETQPEMLHSLPIGKDLIVVLTRGCHFFGRYSVVKQSVEQIESLTWGWR